MDWISSGKLSEFFTMAKSADTTSTKSSIFSGKATSIKKTVKKSANTITRPFKKFKQENLVHKEYIVHYEGKNGVVIPTPDTTNLV